MVSCEFQIDQSRVINITSQLSPDEYDTVLEFAAIASIYTKPNMTDKVHLLIIIVSFLNCVYLYCLTYYVWCVWVGNLQTGIYS